ncbi:hypothetical protein ACLMJK_008089 [Lecanora helva]
MSSPASTILRSGHRAENFRAEGYSQVQIGDRYYYNSNPAAPPSPFRNKHFEVPRNASTAFTGREDVCEQLRARCLPSSTSDRRGQQKRYVIHGLGGSGKTQVCLKFVEDHREEFWGVFWVDASSAESLERGYLQIANTCGLEARVDIARRWLSNVSKSWALILDNADDPRLDLSKFLPVGNRGVILITSRNPECMVYATVGSYELGAMNVDEAVTLMLKTAGIRDLSSQSTRESAKPVVLTLGYLALAITQAGAVIRQGRCRIEEYCELYARRRKELLSQQAIQGGDDYRYTVYTTWEVSWEMIEKMSNEAGEDALELLRMFSFLYYESISEEIFSQAYHTLRNSGQSDWMLSHLPKIILRQSYKEWDVDNFRTAISVLLSFSLVYQNKENLISIHPLVHTWIRDRLGQLDEETVWTQTASTVAFSIPWTFQIANYRFRQALIPHIDTCLSFRSEGIFYLEDIGNDCQSMASGIALVYSEAGRVQKALQMTKQVVETRKRTLGEEHPDTLSSIHNLAIRYSEAGERQKALQIMEQVVETRKRTLGEEHPNTLGSIHSLANRYSEAGERQKALQITEQVVEIYKRTLGEEYPDTLSSIHNLAIRYSEAGERQKALQITEQVVEIYKRTLGEEHPDTLRSIHNLAIRYSEAGERQKALQITEQVVETRKRTLGEEHPDTLRSIHNLAIRYSEAGERQKALQITEQVVETRKRTLGEEHPDTLRSIHNLAIRYSEAGERQKALQITEQVVEIYKRTLGEKYPDTLHSLRTLNYFKQSSKNIQERPRVLKGLVRDTRNLKKRSTNLSIRFRNKLL